MNSKFWIVIIGIFATSLAEAQSDVDSLYKDLTFDTISQQQFEKYVVTNIKNQQNYADNPTSFDKLGIREISNCDQICETYLQDTVTGKTMWIPSNYDQGVFGLSFSPKGSQFVVFSSYDGPIYEDYYDYRSEFFVFNILNGTGLDVIKLSFNYFSTEWSIDDLVWVNEHSLAVKIYTEARWGDGSHLNFIYLITEIK